MDDHYITGTELFLIAIFGMLIPWFLSIAIQTKVYARNQLPKRYWFYSAFAMTLAIPLFGVILWITIPLLTMAWQSLALNFPASLLPSFMMFAPVGPMLLSAIVIIFPITAWFVKRFKPSNSN